VSKGTPALVTSASMPLARSRACNCAGYAPRLPTYQPWVLLAPIATIRSGAALADRLAYIKAAVPTTIALLRQRAMAVPCEGLGGLLQKSGIIAARLSARSVGTVLTIFVCGDAESKGHSLVTHIARWWRSRHQLRSARWRRAKSVFQLRLLRRRPSF